jgi:glutamate 5-kinase
VVVIFALHPTILALTMCHVSETCTYVYLSRSTARGKTRRTTLACACAAVLGAASVTFCVAHWTTTTGAMSGETNGHTNAASSVIVIKVGTSSLLKAADGCLHLSQLCALCETVSQLSRAGHRVVLVSSGAVGAGMIKMGITPGPVKPTLAKKQALAAIGQPHLMRYYEDIFNTLGVKCAQVLLTLENLSNRTQYGKAKNTFDELFEMGVVPVVNENDTVAVEELKFGDNDTLSAKVAALVEAKYLFLLTDVDGLYTANPASDPNAKKIDVVEDINALDVDVNSGAGSNVGTGGMVTKLTAARIACAAGCQTIICLASQQETAIVDAIAGKQVGTKFLAAKRSARGKKRWLLSVPVKGNVWVDEHGAKAVLSGMALMVVNCTKVQGNFGVQEGLVILDENGAELARGLANYTSSAIGDVLQHGDLRNEFEDDEPFVHSNNVIVTNVETLAKSFVLHQITTYGSVGDLDSDNDSDAGGAA